MLDIVEFGADLYLALRDDPGLCPDDGWRLIAPRGKAGEKARRDPAGIRARVVRLARRSPSGGSAARVFALSRSTATERRARRYVCANCSRNS